MLTNIGDADQLEGLGDLKRADQASRTAAVPCSALLGSNGPTGCIWRTEVGRPGSSVLAAERLRMFTGGH